MNKKQKSRKLILNYLESKNNYIYASKSMNYEDLLLNYEKANLLLKLMKEDLNSIKPSMYYTIECKDKNIKIVMKRTGNANSFNTFNMPSIKKIKSILVRYMLDSISLNDNSIDKVFYFFLLDYRERLTENRKLEDLEIFKKYISIDKTNSIVFGNDDLDIEQKKFLLSLLKNSKTKKDEKKDTDYYSAIFLPVHLYIDIFEENYNLLEINIGAKKRDYEHLKKNAKKYNEFFNYFSPENFLEAIEETYREELSYLNPFDLFENECFFEPLLNLVKKFNKKDNFLYSFLNTLNSIQYSTAKIQQENLFYYYMIYKSKDKRYSNKIRFKEFINKVLDSISLYSDLNDIAIQERMCYLNYFQRVMKSENLNNTGITIEKLGCRNFDEDSKKKADEILTATKEGLLKINTMSLKNINNKFSKTIISIFKENDLQLTNFDKNYIRDIVLYIITYDFDYINLKRYEKKNNDYDDYSKRDFLLFIETEQHLLKKLNFKHFFNKKFESIFDDNRKKIKNLKNKKQVNFPTKKGL